jgi:hypothetical protein
LVEPEAVLDELAAKGEVQTHPPADPDEIDAFEREAGVRLPAAHRRLLLLTNGFEAFHGYFRMFGVGPDATIDMRTWNAPDVWKFAYQGAADPYLCFAELGSGHQFAYRFDECRDPVVPAYNLLANDMSEVIRYPDFETFLASPILHGSLYHDGDFLDWIHRLEDLAPHEHVAHRSYGVLDESRGEHFEKVGAVEAMIYYGDAWCSEQPDRSEPESLEFYTDEAGRRRLRIVWR